MSYITDIPNTKKYRGNVVILIGAQYFAIRAPDTGLAIAAPFDKIIASVNLNPTTVDVQKVTTTLASFSFRLVDRAGVVSALVLGDGSPLMGKAVRMWVGLSGQGMDFADYFELPQTNVQKFDHSDNSYVISSIQPTERIDRPIYTQQAALAGDILAPTTVWTMANPITNFPAAGFLKVDAEFVSYTGLDLVNNRFTGVVRGELSSVPAAHKLGAIVVQAEAVTDNPINIILKLLVSGGGGSAYDVLQSGCALDQNLIDIAGMEALRDELFLGVQFTLALYSITSALKTIEDELLLPNNMRFAYARNSKLTVVVLDKARFVAEEDVINEDTITAYPSWTIDGSKVVNGVIINWDYDDVAKVYRQLSTYSDAPSIALYGLTTPLTFNFKGPKAALGGQALMDRFGGKILARIASPTPVVKITTQIDKSLQNVGEAAYLVTTKVPAADGSLNFASDLEIISRSINQTTGDVQFSLAFTSYTNMRSAFIAPSDLILTALAANEVVVATGRGAQYAIGWKMKLWDTVANAYCADAVNTIVGFETDMVGDGLLTEADEQLLTEGGDNIILDGGGGLGTTGDVIIFQNNWATAITDGRYVIRFADYDHVIDSQKRYGFLSLNGANFGDTKPTYKVTY